MDDSSTFKILCVRHGKTNYTGIFPDLTEEGAAHIQRIANDRILHWVRHLPSQRLRIITSPAPRARGTAWMIAEEIGYIMPVTIRDEIDAMRWRNKERCLVACNGLQGKGYIDYETEPIFTDPDLFETPNEVRARWYAFLAKYITMVFSKTTPEHVIFVSHYEVFCNITRDFFGIIANKDTALAHGELIELDVGLTSDPTIVRVSGTFREEKVVIAFDLLSHAILQA